MEVQSIAWQSLGPVSANKVSIFRNKRTQANVSDMLQGHAVG